MYARVRLVLFFLLLTLTVHAFAQKNATETAYGNCPAPATPGVHLCFPVNGAIATPFQVIATGTGAGGPVQEMQLFIDGQKFEQVAGNLFDLAVDISSSNLSMGTHRIVVVERDSTGQFKASDPVYINVEASTVEYPCDTPSSPGVNLCYPAPGSCQEPGYTTVVASGSSRENTAVVRLELWVNGAKLYNGEGNYLNTNLLLQPGDRVVVQEVDSSGGHIASAPAYVNPC